MVETTSTSQVSFELGKIVMLKEDFISDGVCKVGLKKGKTAAILHIDAAGDALLDAGHGPRWFWVFKNNFEKWTVHRASRESVP